MVINLAGGSRHLAADAELRALVWACRDLKRPARGGGEGWLSPRGWRCCLEGWSRGRGGGRSVGGGVGEGVSVTGYVCE